MRSIFLALALLCAACACTLKHPPHKMDAGYATELVRHEYAVTAEVWVYCTDASGEVVEGYWGTAVAVGPEVAMTARHVAVSCIEKSIPGTEIVLITKDGVKHHVEKVLLAPYAWHDAATLSVDVNFTEWAEVADELPPIGAQLCLVAARPVWSYKCGTMGNYEQGKAKWMGEGYGVYNINSIGGNSGGPVFDEKGKIVALNVAAGASGGGYMFPRWAWMVPPVEVAK